MIYSVERMGAKLGNKLPTKLKKSYVRLCGTGVGGLGWGAEYTRVVGIFVLLTVHLDIIM